MKKWFLMVAMMAVLGSPQFVLASFTVDKVNSYPPATTPTDSTLNVAVAYDGEGEATVAAELAIGGLDSEVKTLTVTIPGTSVRVLRAFYRYQTDHKVDGASCEEDVVYTPANKDTKVATTYHCVSLLQAVADLAADSVRETVTLPVPLATNTSAQLTLAYKAIGSATKNTFGVSHFSFETPTVALDLANVQVRVDVSDDLYLKGGSSETNYQDDGSLAEGLAVATLQSFSNKYATGLDYSFSDAAAFIKSTSNLDPNESFTVSGTYATSWFALSWLQLVIAFVILILLILLIFWGERRAAHHQEPK